MSPSKDLSLTGWGNRGPLEIRKVILEACKESQLKTHIMYRCNLNIKPMSQHLNVLESSGLIERLADGVSGRTTYRTTKKGEKYIEVYRRLEGIFM